MDAFYSNVLQDRLKRDSQGLTLSSGFTLFSSYKGHSLFLGFLFFFFSPTTLVTLKGVSNGVFTRVPLCGTCFMNGDLQMWVELTLISFSGLE